MLVVSVVLAGLMMRSRGAIRLGMRIACRRNTNSNRISSLLTLDPRFEGVRIQCVRLHDRAIRRRESPGSDKLDSVCIGPYWVGTHLTGQRDILLGRDTSYWAETHLTGQRHILLGGQRH